MKVQDIKDLANILDTSIDGKVFNTVQIYRDEYDYLIELTGRVNKYDGFCDDVITMDYYGEFIELIQEALKVEDAMTN